MQNKKNITEQEFDERYTYNAATDKLGEGGFGSVFKAYDNHRDRWVALKIAKVNPQYENIRLRKEVEMVAKLPSHPNIAYYEECYTFPQRDGEYDFGILQYYEEGNLMQLLKNNTLQLHQKLSILTQILNGIEFLHQNSIIHRDLKPQNILMVKRGNEYISKITDFGISKQLDINKSSVFSNSIAGAGTLAYGSPEQLGDKEIRKNTDLWSFGVIAFQVFTGKLPFTTGEHPSTSEAGRTELFRQINSGQLPKEIENIPEFWQTLIRKCLVVDPAQRMHNVAEAKEILEGKQKAESTKAESAKAESAKAESRKQKAEGIYPAGGGLRRWKEDVPDEETHVESPTITAQQPVPPVPPVPNVPPKPKNLKPLWFVLGGVVIVIIVLLFLLKPKPEPEPVAYEETVEEPILNIPEQATYTQPSPNTETQDRLERERKAKEERDRLERERAKEEQDRLERERAKEEQDRLDQEKKEKEKAAKLVQQANSVFNNNNLGAARYEQSLQLYKEAKGLGGDVSAGYRNFLSEAKTLIEIGAGFDTNVKKMLLYAKQLNDTQEVRDYLKKCN